MKFLVVFLAFCALGLCAPPADKEALEKQKHVLSLFKHVHQPSYYEEHVKFNQTYQNPAEWLDQHKSSWVKPEVVDHVIKFFHQDYWLHHDEIFSIAHFHHKHQAATLFKLFYYAKDFDTFYKVAMIMREHMNEGLFVYAISVAIVHRRDTQGVVLPPIYEIWPWHFYNGEVITEAWKQKQMHEVHPEDHVKHIYHVLANYSGHYVNVHHEQQLSYFLEDVGINAFHYYYHLYYPSWMDGKEFQIENDHRGRLFIDFYRSMVARWYLERLSHGHDDVPTIDEDVHVDIPFYPSLMYPNGLPFPARPKFADLHNYYNHYGQQIKSIYANSLSFVQDYKRRISDAIDSGFVISTEAKLVDIVHNKDVDGVEIIGNMIQGTPNSPHPKYYGNWWDFMSHALGYAPSELSYRQLVPSVLEHPETMMRDPVFYPMMKKMLFFWYKFSANWEKHHEVADLVWPGVSITGVEMDRLITYMEDFESDISNAVWDSVSELKDNRYHVHVIQQRLNHKPFTYKIHVQSDKDVHAMVKVMIGPKYNHLGHKINMTENIFNFVPFDQFQWHVKVGENVIKRSSQESVFYGHDRISYEDLEMRVKLALDSQKDWRVDGSESYWLFPHRYMLPKGTHGGTPYQFYFFVYPYQAYTGQKDDVNVRFPRPGTGGGYLDNHPLFYPMDKPIYLDHIFEHHVVPNGYFYETKVYHRSVQEAGVVKVPKH